MYEFFTVVDASHDDPTFYPTLSAPDAAYPFEWEAADGDRPQVLTTKSVAVSQYSGRGWTRTNSFKDLNFTVVVTEARVVVYCEKFTKGGGWRGFGAGGLAMALVANAVSHARAAARRRGKLLVAQTRFTWLSGVTVLNDKRGRPSALRLMVDAGTANEPRPLALDIALKERDRPEAFASAIATIAARRRLADGAEDADTRAELQQVASGAASGPLFALPGAARVGAAPRQSVAVQAPAAQPSLGERASTTQPERAPEPEHYAEPAVAAVGCSACGAPLTAGALSCGRCGSTVRGLAASTPPSRMPGGDPADVASTTRRSAVLEAATVAAELPWNTPRDIGVTQTGVLPASGSASGPVGIQDTQVVPDFRPTMPPSGGTSAAQEQWASTPAAPVAQPPAVASTPPPATAPPEVWLVSAGLLALAALVLYPVLKIVGPAVPDLFDGSRFARAFAALILEVGVVLVACGAALAMLAWGLVRGSRVAQLLTCLVAVVVSIGEIVAAQNREAGQPAVATGVAVGCALITALIVLLLAGSPGSRAFFGRDTRPAGVIIAATADVYLGGVAVLDGVLLMIAGTVSREFVWYGLALGVVGVVLVSSSAAVRRGSPTARATSVIGYLAFIAALLAFADKYDQLSSPSTLVPIGLVAAALIGLLLSPASQAYFAGGAQGWAPPRTGASGSAVAAVLAGVLVVAAAAYGSTNAPNDSQYSATDYSPDSSYSTDGSEPVSSSSGITQSDAQTEASTTFDALEGNGSADVCGGNSLPSVDVYDYRIRDVSPATSGTFTVSADVSLNDGTYETVSYLVTDDGTGSACVEAGSFNEQAYTPDDPSSSDQPSTPSNASGGTSPTVPDDVPSVPSSDDPVPTDAPLPGTPAGSAIPYASDTTPTSEDEIVEYQAGGLDSDQTAAVRTVIGFMTYINQQDFQSAWNLTTYRERGTAYTSNFRHGYLTSRFYQVEFGEPSELSGDLIVVPGRFVSKQDPSAQGDPDGVTTCSYWPQYMFTLVNVGGRWLLDTSGKYAGRSELTPLKRETSDGPYLNPVAQREDCS